MPIAFATAYPSSSSFFEFESEGIITPNTLFFPSADLQIYVVNEEEANPELKEEKNRIARANIKARLRMLLLYKEANESNAR